MQPKMIKNRFSTKFAIANGFVIGSRPQVLHCTTANGEKKIGSLLISPDEKAMMREKANNTMKSLRDSTEKHIESKERASLQKMKSRLGMSHDDEGENKVYNE